MTLNWHQTIRRTLLWLLWNNTALRCVFIRSSWRRWRSDMSVSLFLFWAGLTLHWLLLTCTHFSSPSLALGILVRMRNLYRKKGHCHIFFFLSCVLTRQLSPALEWIINYYGSLYNKCVFCKWEVSTLEAAWRTGSEGRGKAGVLARVPILTFSLPRCMVLGKRSLHHLGLSCLNDTVRMPVQPITQSWCKKQLKEGSAPPMAQAGSE